MYTTTPILQTDRLLLRPYQRDDFAACHVYGADPEVSRYMAWGPNNEEDTRRFIEQSMAASHSPLEKGFLFAITLRDTGVLIGGCNLSVTNPSMREAMIGYALDPRYWRRGYTTEASAELLRLGFADLGLHRITSWCAPENIGSWRVMEKIGMRREGHEREAVWFKGSWRDWLRYAILDHEWRAIDDGGSTPSGGTIIPAQ